MTQLDRDIRTFILRALLRYKKPLSTGTLKQQIRAAFPVAFTDGDLGQHISDAEEANLIAGTQDEVLGQVWDLTPKGKIKVQQLNPTNE